MASRSTMMSRGAVFGVAAFLTGALSINFCAWIFACGCRSWWSGASASCNIHLAHAKHCPWCIYDGQGFQVAFLAIFAAQAAISFFPGAMSWPYRFLLALGAFPAVGSIVAGIYGWISHYWS